MAETFIPGYGHNMEAAAQRENLVATAATAATIVRILAPRAGRFVWLLWNKATGEVKTDDAADLIVPNELMEILDTEPQQQQQSPKTPSDSGKKSRRISPLYSKEPLEGNLLPEFEQTAAASTTANQTTAAASTTTYQFGPKTRPTTTTTTTNDYTKDLRLQQDIDKTKIRSIQDGKGERTWGLDDESLNAKTTEA